MAELTRAEVEDIALLARLALGDDELERLRGDLTQVLAHVEALRAVDTTGVEPMTHVIPRAQALRPDVVAPSLPVERALAASPAQREDMFVVPHIIPKRDDP